MVSLDDFSTNHAAVPQEGSKSTIETKSYQPHSLSFEDGNLVIIVEDHFFIVHQGFICRHSSVLQDMIKEAKDSRKLLNRPVLELKEKWADFGCFLSSLYDGMTQLNPSIEDFEVLSAVLLLSSKYRVEHVRTEVLRKLAPIWPKNLPAWDIRESNATNSGLYKPRAIYPHPIMIIPVLREAKAMELLPSALYDLTRCAVSDIVKGWSYPADPATAWNLSNSDIMTVLKGKEHASRFLSTFIVNQMEGREPSSSCLYKNDTDPYKKRICPAAFEAITFEIVRDCNGMVCHRVTDPLFAILDSYLLHKRNNPIGRGKISFRACDACREDFGHAVETARNAMWQKLPAWFGLKLETWPQPHDM